MDILLTLLSGGLQALIAYWGYKLTVDPIETPQQRRWYRAGFITIGVVGVALTVTQQWLNGREQAELLAKIDGLGTGVEQVRSQTQQPPTVTVNLPQPLVQLLPAPTAPPRPGNGSAAKVSATNQPPAPPTSHPHRARAERAPVVAPHLLRAAAQPCR